MAHIIQISGKKRHGKDTVAKLLADNLPGSVIMPFAAPIKRILATTLGMSVEQLDNLKNSDDTYRTYLQHFGNEAMKSEFGEDVWVKLLFNEVYNLPVETVVIIPDWRFNVEIIDEAFKVRVNRPSVPLGPDTHLSETELDTYDCFDYVLENPEGALELLKEVDKLLLEIKDHFDLITTTELTLEPAVEPLI